MKRYKFKAESPTMQTAQVMRLLNLCLAQAKSIRDMIADNRASDVGEDDIGRLLFANIICENSTDTTESD